MHFTAELEATGGTTTGLEVPEAVVAGLGAGCRPAVVVTVRGHTWRSSFGSRGGRVLLGISAAHREAAGVEAGDRLDVEVVVDDAPREVERPEILAAALAADDAARTFYESLSVSAQRGFAEPIGATPNPETAQRRLEKAMTALREGRKRP